MRKNLKTILALMLCLGTILSMNLLPYVKAESVSEPKDVEGLEDFPEESANPAEEPAVVEQTPAPVQDVVEEVKAENGKVTATANGKVTLEPDFCSISLAVESVEETAKLANQVNSELMNKIFELLKAQGIAEEDFHTGYYSIWPERNYFGETTELVGYRVSNQVIVKIRDLDKVGEIIALALEEGANNVNDIHFDVDDTADAYDEALVLAIQRGRKKAEIMAAAVGKTLKVAPLEIIEGSLDYSAAMNYGRMKEEAALDGGMGGAPPIAKENIVVRASVTLIYEFE